MARTIKSLLQYIEELRELREKLRKDRAKAGHKLTKAEQEVARIIRKEKAVDAEPTSE